MSGLLVGVLIVLVALVFWLAMQNTQSGKKGAALESQMNEMRRDLQDLAKTQASNSGNISAIAQTVTQRLDTVSLALQEGVAQSATIAADGQKAVALELQNTREMMQEMQQRLGEFQELNRGITRATQSLESVLGGAKSRGLLGEIALERLLEDSLPSSHFKTQFRFGSGEAADAVIFLRDGKLFAIDSKFPLDAFRRIETEGDDARRAFATAVKGHADSIARKYIVPGEGTLDFALMFVPSESVYYELLNCQDNKGQPLDAYCREKNIVAVSPNTLYAHLSVIAMGLRGMQIEENARRIAAGLAGVQKNLDTFSDFFAKLGNHIKNVQQTYLDSEKRLDKTHNLLSGMLNTAENAADIEPAQGSLALPPAKSRTASS